VLFVAAITPIQNIQHAGNISNEHLGSVLQLPKEQQRIKSVERSKALLKRQGQKRICKETYR
jgi:hypothetical protein